MSLIDINGDVGSGKTTFATTLALMSDQPHIYANYNIKTDNYVPIEPQDLWTIRDGVVVLDEIYEWLDSRTSGSHINRYVSQLIFKSRKRNLDIIVISQMSSVEDKRIRDMAQFTVLAEDAGEYFRYTIMHNSITNPTIKKIRMSKKIFDIVGPYFDTMEDHEIPYDLIGDAVIDKRTLMPHVKEVADTIKDPDKWTMAACKNYCMWNHEPRIFAELLYGELKARGLKK